MCVCVCVCACVQTGFSIQCLICLKTKSKQGLR